MNTRLVTFYCVCLLLGANCDEQAVQDGISGRLNSKVDSLVQDGTIRPETGRGAYDVAFVGLPRKNIEQTPTLTLKDLPKGELATLEKDLSPVFSEPSKPVDFEEKRGLTQQRSNGRSSMVSRSKGDRNVRESGFPVQVFSIRTANLVSIRGAFNFLLLFFSGDRFRQLDSVASRFKSVTDSLLKGKEGGRQARDLPGLFDLQKLLHLPDFLFKNGNSENIGLPALPGLPGQPIRKFIEFLREKLTNKHEETNEDRPEDHLLLKRFFELGKELSGNVQENV